MWNMVMKSYETSSDFLYFSNTKEFEIYPVHFQHFEHGEGKRRGCNGFGTRQLKERTAQGRSSQSQQ